MITKLLFLFSFVTPILGQHVNANIYDNPSQDLLNKYYSNMNKCCKTCIMILKNIIVFQTQPKIPVEKVVLNQKITIK